jgi:hypothetical protein
MVYVKLNEPPAYVADVEVLDNDRDGAEYD